MTEQRLRFAIFGNTYKARDTARIGSILSVLRQHGATILMERQFARQLSKILRYRLDIDELIDGRDFEADFALSLGGDGTVLKAACRVGEKQIPMLGINMGRLGFLASVLPEEFATAVEDIYQGAIASTRGRSSALRRRGSRSASIPTRSTTSRSSSAILPR